MSETVIKVENLGKKYIIAHQGKGRYKTFREELIHQVHDFYSRTRRLLAGQPVLEGDEMEEFWALKDINFEIKQGERVGIIGRNGAGKSTLLKILSRITEPTTGRVSIKGRVASLLEVGTGFHQELTGRENIFLNGAILGMSRAEIKRKFDEIVEFSGVEKFLDTPVKRYSSGMYVRLAFSVAAHLEPEILIVDEVLAVGDAEFQKKCLGKMKEVSEDGGRTVLFVSHQMGLIAQLCQRAIFLKNGIVQMEGKAENVITNYNNESVINTSYSGSQFDKEVYFEKIEIRNIQGKTCNLFGHNESIFIYLRIRCKIPGKTVQTTIALLDKFQNRVFTLHIPLTKLKAIEGGYEGILQLQENLITPQDYNFLFDLFIPFQAILDQISGYFPIKVFDNGSQMAGYENISYGYYFMNYKIIN